MKGLSSSVDAESKMPRRKALPSAFRVLHIHVFKDICVHDNEFASA